MGRANDEQTPDRPSGAFISRALAVALPRAPTPRYWITLVAAALLVRVVVALGLLGQMPLFSDAMEYSRQAEHLVHGVYGDRPYYWPVGTSYLLAGGYWLFGAHAWVARALMIVVSVLSVVTTVLLGRRLLRDTRTALLAGWALALFPGMALAAAEPYSFDLTLLTVNVTALFALRAWESGHLRDYAVVGLALGVAGLTRPSTLSVVLALGVVAAVALRRRRREGLPTGVVRVALGSFVLLACAGVVVAPAVAHNAATGQGPTLSVNNELNLWFGNNPYTPNYKTPDLGQHDVADNPPVIRRYLMRFAYGEDPTLAQRRAARDEALRFIVHHPGTTLLRTANRARAFWGFEYSISSLLRTDWHKGVAAEAVGFVFEAGGYLLLALLAIVGLTVGRGLFRHGAIWYLLAMTIAFELPYALDFSAGRWHYPVLGMLAVAAAAGVAWLIKTSDWRQRLRGSRAFCIALAIFLVVEVEYGVFMFGWHNL